MDCRMNLFNELEGLCKPCLADMSSHVTPSSLSELLYVQVNM